MKTTPDDMILEEALSLAQAWQNRANQLRTSREKAVQQKMMRHASIVTTMDHYGDVVTDEMATAHSKVVSLAMNGM